MNENLRSKDEWEISVEHALEIYLQKCCKVTRKATDEPVTNESRPAITEKEQALITSDEDDDAESISSQLGRV